ncbi:serine carboxypeptidase 1-like [Miscanthus floridulus]|uniref:serine carboxypeptidase 1-like n=1 Tax=Miscanthus floridulus TaxID=154761 RepID=UPI003457FAB4
MRIDAYLTHLMLLLLVSVAVLHANASQQAQLEKFILSRKGRTSASSKASVHDSGVRVKSGLHYLQAQAGYLGSDQSALKAADKITALPGQPHVDFDQYSGYVTVDEKHGRALFYYFVEAPRDASSKPLLLWLNGGPGCSSFIGAMLELGPFRVNFDNTTLRLNKYAWNKEANVIFLESPAGVGFSYSNTSSDYEESGDSRTAEDAYIFLVNWLERFPEYKTRAFYISGESYAGHYVPQLAATILSHNLYNNRTIVNLQGILVGNPYLDDYKNQKGRFEYLWNHGVLSDEAWANITNHCSFNSSDNKLCSEFYGWYDFGPIDPYNIYAPICIDEPDGSYHSSSYLPGYNPCDSYPTVTYLNDPVVQEAFHARKTEWGGCSDLDWKDAPESMVPTLQWLIKHGLPVWLFSGDFDAICPLTATRYSIQELNVSVTTPWRPWTAKMEVGGYVQQYAGGFTFITVRAAGHMVPSFQPERGLILLSYFLKGVLPPYIQEQ